MIRLFSLIFIMLLIIGCDGTTVEYDEEESLNYPDRDPYENACTCIEDQ